MVHEARDAFSEVYNGLGGASGRQIGVEYVRTFCPGGNPRRLAEYYQESGRRGSCPIQNIAPTENAVAITREPGKQPIAEILRWGLLTPWETDPANGARMINARAETVAEKPSFRNSYEHRRCLVPAMGFYEWKRSGKQKTPYYFSANSDNRPIVLGGIWTDWNHDQQHIRSFSIITTEANDVMRPIHDRMPLIITPEYWLDWLNHDLSGRAVSNILKPAKNNILRCWEVSPYVNNVRNKGERCIFHLKALF